MGKVDENKRLKKKKLFTSAYELFTSKGFTNTSISDIVTHADVAKGTFYLYFKDKYDLKDQLTEYMTREIILSAGNAAYKAGVSTLEDRLIFIVEHIVDTLANDHGLLELIAKNLIMGVLRHQLIDNNKNQDNEIYTRFMDMVEADEYDYDQPEVLLFTIVETAGSTFYNSIRYNEPLPLEDYKPIMFNIIRLIIQSFRK